jgi:hypothetical protein
MISKQRSSSISSIPGHYTALDSNNNSTEVSPSPAPFLASSANNSPSNDPPSSIVNSSNPQSLKHLNIDNMMPTNLSNPNTPTSSFISNNTSSSHTNSSIITSTNNIATLVSPNNPNFPGFFTNNNNFTNPSTYQIISPDGNLSRQTSQPTVANSLVSLASSDVNLNNNDNNSPPVAQPLSSITHQAYLNPIISSSTSNSASNTPMLDENNRSYTPVSLDSLSTMSSVAATSITNTFCEELYEILQDIREKADEAKVPPCADLDFHGVNRCNCYGKTLTVVDADLLRIRHHWPIDKDQMKKKHDFYHQLRNNLREHSDYLTSKYRAEHPGTSNLSNDSILNEYYIALNHWLLTPRHLEEDKYISKHKYNTAEHHHGHQNIALGESNDNSNNNSNSADNSLISQRRVSVEDLPIVMDVLDLANAGKHAASDSTDDDLLRRASTKLPLQLDNSYVKPSPRKAGQISSRSNSPSSIISQANQSFQNALSTRLIFNHDVVSAAANSASMYNNLENSSEEESSVDLYGADYDIEEGNEEDLNGEKSPPPLKINKSRKKSSAKVRPTTAAVNNAKRRRNSLPEGAVSVLQEWFEHTSN